MLIDTIRDYHDYTEWANDRILTASEGLTEEQFVNSDLSGVWPIRDSLVHMVWAQVTWLSRWRPETPRFKTKSSELPDLASIRSNWNDVNREMRLLLDGLDDGQLASKDDLDDFPLGMQLIHLANHQTYHRGEVAALLTRYGCSPGELDMNRWVVWKRKRTT